MNRFESSSPLGYFGLVGGLVIAVGLPWLMLVYGSDLSAAVRVTVIILALCAGALLAIASIVIGITVPSALRNGKLDIGAIAGCCGTDVEEAAREVRTECCGTVREATGPEPERPHGG